MGAAGGALSSFVLSHRVPDQRSSSSPPPSRLLSYIGRATQHSWSGVAEAPRESRSGSGLGWMPGKGYLSEKLAATAATTSFNAPLAINQIYIKINCLLILQTGSKVNKCHGEQFPACGHAHTRHGCWRLHKAEASFSFMFSKFFPLTFFFVCCFYLILKACMVSIFLFFNILWLLFQFARRM